MKSDRCEQKQIPKTNFKHYLTNCFVFPHRYKKHPVGGPSSAESSYHRTCECLTHTDTEPMETHSWGLLYRSNKMLDVALNICSCWTSLIHTLSSVSLYNQDKPPRQHHSAYQHPCPILCTTSDTVSGWWQLWMCGAVLILMSQVQPVWKVCDSFAWDLLSVQAVPYSREFKQKYDYFRKKLKKPVRPKFQFYACDTWTTYASAAFS